MDRPIVITIVTMTSSLPIFLIATATTSIASSFSTPPSLAYPPSCASKGATVADRSGAGLRRHGGGVASRCTLRRHNHGPQAVTVQAPYALT